MNGRDERAVYEGIYTYTAAKTAANPRKHHNFMQTSAIGVSRVVFTLVYFSPQFARKEREQTNERKTTLRLKSTKDC